MRRRPLQHVPKEVIDFFEDDDRRTWTIREHSQLKRQWRLVRRAPVIVQIIIGLFALTWFTLGFFATTATVQDPTDVKYYPSDEPLRMGKEQFGRGNYGLSERYFRDAAEKAPRDATAWIGLAVSYDRLRRFDLADRAYAQAVGLMLPAT